MIEVLHLIFIKFNYFLGGMLFMLIVIVLINLINNNNDPGSSI